MTIEIQSAADAKILVQSHISQQCQAISVGSGSAVHLSLSVEVSIVHRGKVRLAVCIDCIGHCINDRYRCKLNNLIAEIEYSTIFHDHAKSGGNILTIGNIHGNGITQDRERVLDSQGGAVHSETGHTLGCIDDGNIIKYNVLCAVNVDACSVVVAIKHNILQSHIVGVDTNQVSLILLQI